MMYSTASAAESWFRRASVSWMSWRLDGSAGLEQTLLTHGARCAGEVCSAYLVPHDAVRLEKNAAIPAGWRIVEESGGWEAEKKMFS